MSLSNEQLSFVECTEEFLRMSWMWLNDPEIRSLTNTPIFSRLEQSIWFERVLKDTDTYYIRVLAMGEELIGAIGLKNIRKIEREGEYWGYIGVKQYWGKGLSKQIFDYIKTVSVRDYGLERLYLFVSESNERAIKAYEKAGFVRKICKGGVIKMELIL